MLRILHCGILTTFLIGIANVFRNYLFKIEFWHFCSFHYAILN
nr:MAG TPA: hypothetical protein [Caudoviricetes sp.]